MFLTCGVHTKKREKKISRAKKSSPKTHQKKTRERILFCVVESIERDMMTTTATRAQTTPWKQQQQQRPRFLTSRASVSFSSSSSSSSLLSKSSSSKGGGRQQPRRGHRRRRSLPDEGAKTGRGVVVAGRFPDERTYIMIKCVVVYVVVVVFRLSS